MPVPSHEWSPNGLCSLFVCDIASFGHPDRNEAHHHRLRDALYTSLRKAFDGEDVAFDSCYREDRGDGALVAVPPWIDTAVLLTSLIERLRAEVRRHNDLSAGEARMQLRLAVHAGYVHTDEHGLVGVAVNHVFRLLEASQLKQVLQRTGADLAMIASDDVYQGVIRHGLGLVDPGEYFRLTITVKETAGSAWLRVPGGFAAVRAVPAYQQAVPARPALTASPPTTPDPPVAVTIIDEPSEADIAVDRALDIPRLRHRRIRDQIVAELPLALTTTIRTRRSDDDWADLTVIVTACREQPRGLQEFLRAVRQFVGDSPQMRELTRAVETMGSA
ncbi:hypothetical protein [Spirillospora sp. NPDC047279]|uniref:effector-associated domain 2-containing protein n=1 Tax=Spirillospora sp. NPDC047279 TaxID=3155478 RepID=UPI0033ED3822